MSITRRVGAAPAKSRRQMRRINVAEPKFEYDASDPEGFRAGMARVGPSLGASQIGTSVYELAPGQAICPYHYEYAEEEWLIVLEGTPTLRHPDGSEVLRPWDVAFFGTGPAGAHGVRNETSEPVLVTPTGVEQLTHLPRGLTTKE